MAFHPLASIPRSGRQLGLLLAFTGMFIVSTDSLLIRVAERDSQIDGWTIAFICPLNTFYAADEYRWVVYCRCGLRI